MPFYSPDALPLPLLQISKLWRWSIDGGILLFLCFAIHFGMAVSTDRRNFFILIFVPISFYRDLVFDQRALGLVLDGRKSPWLRYIRSGYLRFWEKVE